MKKWFVLVAVICAAFAVQAEEAEGKKKGEGKEHGKPVTKEMFMANQKKQAEKKGVEFDQAKAEALFKKKDKNNDGVLTADEKGKKKGKGKDKDKKPAPEAAE